MDNFYLYKFEKKERYNPMKYSKILLIIVSSLSIIFILIFMLLKYSKSKSSERSDKAKKTEQEQKCRKLIISYLKKDIEENKKILEKKPNVTFTRTKVKECTTIKMKNGKPFYVKDQTVLVNAANTKFKINRGGLNKGITDFVSTKNGIFNGRWRNLFAPEISKYKDRIRISKFNYGYILHLVGLQASELEGIKMKIEDVDEYLIGLYLTGLSEIEKILPRGNVLLCCVSEGIYASDGVDFQGVNFTQDEFILRAKRARLIAVVRYEGTLNIVINN